MPSWHGSEKMVRKFQDWVSDCIRTALMRQKIEMMANHEDLSKYFKEIRFSLKYRENAKVLHVTFGYHTNFFELPKKFKGLKITNAMFEGADPSYIAKGDALKGEMSLSVRH